MDNTNNNIDKSVKRKMMVLILLSGLPMFGILLYVFINVRGTTAKMYVIPFIIFFVLGMIGAGAKVYDNKKLYKISEILTFSLMGIFVFTIMFEFFNFLFTN